MRGATEHCSGTVIHQHEIGDIDGQMPCWIKRMFNGQPYVETHFFGGLNFGSGRAAPATFFNKRLQFRRVFGHRGRKRMICRNCNKARAEHRIGASGEHIDAVMRARQVKGAFESF